MKKTKIKQKGLLGKFTQILHFDVAVAVAFASAKLSSNDLMSMFYPKCSNCHVLRAQPEDFIRTAHRQIAKSLPSCQGYCRVLWVDLRICVFAYVILW